MGRDCGKGTKQRINKRQGGEKVWQTVEMMCGAGKVSGQNRRKAWNYTEVHMDLKINLGACSVGS